MKIIVSAGPTREMIDQVRFLSNLSSGKTGFAVAQAAQEAGHEVVLVHGPVDLPSVSGITQVAVISAADMHQAILDEYTDADVVIMSAAVADYRPAQVHDGKMKKAPGPLHIELERTEDILADLGRKKRHQVLIGFALEVADPEANALRKLKAKNLDLIVLNGPDNFGSASSSFRLVNHDGIAPVKNVTKSSLGALLVRTAVTLANSRHSQD
ncbi:MAG: phosphopantothenoylcysteine decarboxylase/phosphopantothenate--cysteine ligase [Planctomycetota bacterium]|jgi:phosphopantothenoylcysteine decarboxylase/phosphopantothenate--cysteine ligase